MSGNGQVPASGGTGGVVSAQDERALVRTAFAAGWHMATLYITASAHVHGVGGEATAGRWGCDDHREAPPSELSGVALLGEVDRARMVTDRISAALYTLRGRFAAAGLPNVDLQSVKQLLDKSPVGLALLCAALDTAHRAILIALTSAGSHLGQAYDLGRQLAYVTQAPEERDGFERAFGPSLVSAKNVLADLASLLPDHASRSVIISVRAWERWAADPQIGGEELDWDRQLPAIRTALRRQGELWAALLSGEKRGEDMLRATDYVGAAAGLLGEGSRLGLRMLRSRPVLIAAGLITVLLGAGIFLLVATTVDAGKLAGAVLAAAGAVGLTGAGARARAADIASGLQVKLWNAELDGAIASAITIGPTDWGIDVGKDDVPGHGAPPRAGDNLNTLQHFRKALREHDGRRLKDLLAPKAEFGTGEQDHEELVSWLLNDAPERMEDEPLRLLAGRPGYLLAYLEASFDVWRVQEGRVRLWQRFNVEAQARARAGLPVEVETEDVPATAARGAAR
jgi:hypothetical protein